MYECNNKTNKTHFLLFPFENKERNKQVFKLSLINYYKSDLYLLPTVLFTYTKTAKLVSLLSTTKAKLYNLQCSAIKFTHSVPFRSFTMDNCGNFFFFSSNNSNHHHHRHRDNLSSSSTVYGGDGSHVHPDPHLMCLKLGKRHYFENPSTNTTTTSSSSAVSPKRGKPYYALTSVDGSSTSAAVPRCQVEGCHVALVDAKDYHKRHKVCEMHSKAPKVIVLGLEQRFCQQCSRFHVVSEFDETKRSCRRRLAGHNERRRKSSHDSASKNTASQDRLIMGRLQYLTSPTGCALSLLSSKSDSWVSSSSSHHDISSRSSAALRELIAEHRATILARQLILDRNLHHHIAIEDLSNDHHSHTSVSTSNSLVTPHHHLTFAETGDWNRINDIGSHLTLD